MAGNPLPLESSEFHSLALKANRCMAQVRKSMRQVVNEDALKFRNLQYILRDLREDCKILSDMFQEGLHGSASERKEQIRDFMIQVRLYQDSVRELLNDIADELGGAGEILDRKAADFSGLSRMLHKLVFIGNADSAYLTKFVEELEATLAEIRNFTGQRSHAFPMPEVAESIVAIPSHIQCVIDAFPQARECLIKRLGEWNKATLGIASLAKESADSAGQKLMASFRDLQNAYSELGVGVEDVFKDIPKKRMLVSVTDADRITSKLPGVLMPLSRSLERLVELLDDYSSMFSETELRESRDAVAITEVREHAKLALGRAKSLIELLAGYESDSLPTDTGNAEPYAAIDRFTEAIEADPTDATNYNMRGSLFATMGRLDDAIRDFTKALELDPNLEDAHYNLATTCYDLGCERLKEGNWPEAIANFTKVIEHAPGTADAYVYRGVAYTQMEKFDEARRDFKKAREIDPGSSTQIKDFEEGLGLGPETGAGMIPLLTLFLQWTEKKANIE